MKITILSLVLLSFGASAFARSPSFSENAFCRDRKDDRFIKDLTLDSSNLMSFQNQGGLLNGGVCWWHSRFQRNALYLTIYNPRLPKPTEREALKIIKKIRKAKEVVTIPGYRNFASFSYDYEDLIQKELNKWQIIDGSIKFAWVDGLRGKPIVKEEKLRSMMDEMYDYVEKEGNIAFNKLQIRGPDAHAWLVVHMDKTYDGYNLEVLDSNDPRETNIYRYHDGDRNLYYHGMKIVPYLEKDHELERIKNIIARKCDS